MKKRVLTAVLVIIMLLTLMPFTVFARNCESVTITNTTLWDDGSLKSMDVTFDWAPAGNEHLYIAVLGEHTERNDDASEYWWQYDEYSHTNPDSITNSINDFAGYRGIDWYSYGGSGSTPVNGNNTINVSFDKGTVPLNVDRNYSFVMFNAPDGTDYRPTDPLGTLKCASSSLSFENTSGASADVKIAKTVTNSMSEGNKETNNGYITIDKATAAEEETVTLTVVPNKNYQLKAGSLIVTYNTDKTIIPEAAQTAGQYTFKMPAYDVTVTAEFEAKAITIADVIATFENFPLTKDTDLYWTNEQGTTCYYFNNNLFFRYTSVKSLMQSMTVNVTANGKNYTYSDGTVTYTFIMDEDSGVLSAITVSGSTDTKYNGTYNAPPTKYTVTNGTTDTHGSIELGKTSAAEGDIVSITVTPAEGYQLKSLTATYFDGTNNQNCEIVTAKGIIFVMPAYDVTVTAVFEEIPHTHNPVKVGGQSATKTAAGWKDYYKCDCGKFFEDAEGKVEITDLAKWKAEGGNGYLPKFEKEPFSPATADTSNMNLWIITLIVSSMGLVACLTLGKKKNIIG